MVTVETVAVVEADGTMVLKGPPTISPGVHRVVVSIDERTVAARDAGSLPDLQALWAELGCDPYPGTSVVDYRSEERS